MSWKLILFWLFIVVSGCFSKKGKDQQAFIGTEALKEDLAILKKTLEEAHPGLYWYASKAGIDSLFDNAGMAIHPQMTKLEFFKTLLPVIAGVRCSHTNLRLAGNNNEMALSYTDLLPFEFYFNDGKAYVRRSFTKDKYQGQQVLSINDTPIEQILNKLLSCIPADGYNQTFKYQVLGHGVMIEGYALHFGDTSAYKMEIKDTSGGVQTIRVNAASPEQIRAAAIQSPLPVFDLKYQDSIAILSINSFQINTRQFADSITAIFRTLKEKGTDQLVIDLRRNGGGNNENVSALFSFIARSPFRHLRQAEMMGQPLTYASHIPNASSLNHYSRNNRQDDRYIVNESYIGTRLTNPRDSFHFPGNVVLLASGNTVSAASEFVALFHYLQRGKIVGEETGGCYYGSTGGNYLHLRLPNSGLEVNIPTIRIFNAVKEDFVQQPKGRGIFPDYTIIPGVEDVISGRDVQMEKAVKVLQ